MKNNEHYKPTKKTKVKRGREHADYSKESIYKILDSSYFCHISYIIEGQPYLTPTVFWRHGNYVYWHGLSTSKMLKEQASGMEVCFNVSHLDGLILGRSAFHHSANYRSVTIYGKSELVDERVDKIAAIDQMIESFYPGRRASLREHQENEIKAVKILRLPIEQVSAKSRYDKSIQDILKKSATYNPEDIGVESSECWAGLIPIRQQFGLAEPDELSKHDSAPSYAIQSKFQTTFGS